MTTPVSLSLSGDQHEKLRHVLFPGDGKEAVAILLCGQCRGKRRYRLCVREIHKVPQAAYRARTEALVTWETEHIVPMLECAAENKLSVIKVHSHPNGYPSFSHTDDESDQKLIPMVRGWVESDIPHGSVVMLPGGEMFGRLLQSGDAFEPIECVSVAGDDLHFWYANAAENTDRPGFLASYEQIFDEGTIQRLRRLSIAVVGASGTGSPVIEQLVRLGVGEIIIVDDDHMEDRNVNRILNSTMRDVRKKHAKVDVQAKAIERMGLGTRVIRMNRNLWDPEVVRAVAQCDVLFGCMDTIDGRYLLNRLATYYTLPYFDIGIRLLPSEEKEEGIREVCGSVHYLQPGCSSLVSRGVFTMEHVRQAGLRRKDPVAHAQQVEEGYIDGVPEHRPAVISVNMYGASLAVNEFLARLHPYREESNSQYAKVEFSLASMGIFLETEKGSCDILSHHIGKGDMTPLLGLIGLSERKPQRRNFCKWPLFSRTGRVR